MCLNAHSRSWDIYVLKKKRDATPDSPDSTPGIESLDPDILFGVLMSRQISESIPKAAHLSGAIFRGKLGSKTFDDLWPKMMVTECKNRAQQQHINRQTKILKKLSTFRQPNWFSEDVENPFATVSRSPHSSARGLFMENLRPDLRVRKVQHRGK